MPKRLLVVLILVAIIALALVGGCGRSDSTLLARIGDRTITADEFVLYVRYVPRSFSTAQEEFDTLHGYLDSMINIQLLIQAAYEMGLDESPQVNSMVAANRPRFLLDALYNEHIVGQSEVTEAELRQLHSDLAYQIRAFHILLHSEDSANIIFEKIKSGEDFEQLAYDFSTDPSARRNRGDLGYFTRGSMVDEFEEVVFRMESGEVSPPVKTSYGYHIIKLIDRRPNELREPYERMRPQLELDLQSKKLRQVTEAYLEKVIAKYPITLDSSVADYVMYKRVNLYPPQILDRLPKNDFDDKQLDRDERELVLATWEGGQMTLMQYLFKVRQSIPQESRPDFDNYDSLRVIIGLLTRNDILVYEATQEVLETGEFFVSKMKLFKEYGMADALRNDSISEPPPPTEEEVRQYYDDHIDEFITPRRVRVYEIALSDELLARKLAGEIKTLDEFKARATQLTERADLRVKRGDMGYIERTFYPALFPVAWKTPVGVVGGPVTSRGKYSIFWVVHKTDKAYKDFLTVKEQLRGRLIQEQKQQVYAEWIRDRKSQTTIEVFEDVLWGIIDTESYANVTSPDTVSQP